MKTGIEKFKNVIDPDTCDKLIQYLENNMHHALDLTHSARQNVVCREITLEPHTELDNIVYNIINKVTKLYAKEYIHVRFHGDTGYQLRKITGETKEHVDNISKNHRNVSIILGLNSNYEKGEFHFPVQDFSTTVKRGEAIVFPVYFMYPHSVDAPIGNRYTINTWITDSLYSFS